MKNYLNYKNYSKQNYANDYNKNYINTDLLFEPYQGFIRGNMFEKIYDPYKIKNPYDIRPMNEQADMLTYIDSLTFACIDLNLYLDVNPNDKGMIELYNQYCSQKKQLINEYENKFGPLLLDSESLNTYPWAWNDQPWPWEN